MCGLHNTSGVKSCWMAHIKRSIWKPQKLQTIIIESTTLCRTEFYLRKINGGLMQWHKVPYHSKDFMLQMCWHTRLIMIDHERKTAVLLDAFRFCLILLYRYSLHSNNSHHIYVYSGHILILKFKSKSRNVVYTKISMFSSVNFRIRNWHMCLFPCSKLIPNCVSSLCKLQIILNIKNMKANFFLKHTTYLWTSSWYFTPTERTVIFMQSTTP
jgi:hypothetical protein